MEKEQDKFRVILRQRARRLSQPLQKKIEKTDRFIVFSLGNEFYSFEVKYAREVMRAEKIAVVPCAPDFVEGVINLRGNIISVVNLAKILNIEDLAHLGDRRVIVVEVGQVEAALHVDSVKGVFDVVESSIEPPLVTLDHRSRGHLKGEARIYDYLVSILNLEKILVEEMG